MSSVAQWCVLSLEFFLASGFALCASEVSAAAFSNSNRPTTIPIEGADIHLPLIPARTSGVAPLSVFFDASGTTDPGVTARPFHDLEYRWSFGDANSGNWEYGSKPRVSSKNSAIGPVASHVFETPGTYTVSVTAFDGKHSATTHTTITVQNPDTVFSGTNTICFSTSATYTGCPSEAKHVRTSNFATAINTYQATGKRLLFKRDETFAAATAGRINKTGPGIIGAFGTGALPAIIGSGLSQILLLSSAATPAIKDWRIMDLDFDGHSTHSGENTGIEAGGGINQVLIFRMNLHNMQRGVIADIQLLDYYNKNPKTAGHTIFEEWAVMDSIITGIPGCNASGNGGCNWRIFFAGKRNSIQGSFVDNQDTAGTHVVRSEYMEKGVISNNTIARAGSSQHLIKLHAWDWATAGVANPGGIGAYTEQVIIADNKLIGGINPWSVSLGPQNSGLVPGEPGDERVRDIIVERNWFTSGSGTQINIETSATDTTIRNNIIDMTGSKYQNAIAVGQRGAIVPIPNNVNIYNNTFYSALSTNECVGVSIGKINKVSVKNNLFYVQTTGRPVMISGTGSGLVQSNNSTNTQITRSAPGWVSAAPLTPADFKLTGSSYAIGAGSLVPVFSDFFLNSRSTNDLGAVEQ